MELEVLSVSGAQPDQVPLSTLDPFQPSRSCPSGRVASGNRPRLRRLGRPVACSVSWRFMALHLVLKAFSDDFESSKGLLEAPGHTLPTLRCGAEPLPGGHPAAGAAGPQEAWAIPGGLRALSAATRRRDLCLGGAGRWPGRPKRQCVLRHPLLGLPIARVSLAVARREQEA